MTKKSYLYDRFLCQIKLLPLKMLKLLKIPGFLVKFPGFSSFFLKISQIPGFSRLFLSKLSNSRFFKVFPGFQVKRGNPVKTNFFFFEIKHLKFYLFK